MVGEEPCPRGDALLGHEVAPVGLVAAALLGGLAEALLDAGDGARPGIIEGRLDVLGRERPGERLVDLAPDLGRGEPVAQAPHRIGGLDLREESRAKALELGLEGLGRERRQRRREAARQEERGHCAILT